MAEELPSGGATTEPKAGGEGSDDTEHRKPDVVPYDRYYDAVTEAKKAKTKFKELEAELKTLRDKAEKPKESDADDDKLSTKYKLAEQKLQETQQRLQEASDRLSNYEQKELLRSKLGALKNELQSDVVVKYARLVDFDQIIVDDNGEIDEFSVRKAAESFKANHPELFVAKQSTGLPTNNPKVPREGGKISRTDFMNLSSAEMRKYRPTDIIND